MDVGSASKRPVMFALLMSIVIVERSSASYEAKGAETKHRRQTPEANSLPSKEFSEEARLIRHLTSIYESYGNIARPILNSSVAIGVLFGLRLIRLDIDEQNQALKISVWVRCVWKDEYMTWNPADYGGIHDITIPSHIIWTPDIYLANTAEAEVYEREAAIMLSHDGRVLWSPHRIYSSACLIDITNYPYDQHECHSWFQSMSHHTWRLELWEYTRSPWNLDTYLNSFRDSQEWEILYNGTEKHRESSEQKVLKFSKRVALKFTLRVRRRPGYLGLLLMVPCVFLGAMSLVVFCLPPERPDRTTLGTSLFTCFLVLLMILVEVAPPTAASIPKLGIYYACNMFLIILSIIISALASKVSRYGDFKRSMPKCVRFIFLEILARPLLLYNYYNLPPRLKSHLSDERDTREAGGSRDTDRPKDKTHFIQDNICSRCLCGEMQHSSTNISMEALDRPDSRVQQLERVRLEWKTISHVIDRLAFIIYSIVLVLIFIFLFPRAM